MDRKQSHKEEVHDVLPDQVLVSVLELLPRQSVLASAALVNKRWMRVSTSKDLWSSKMAPELSRLAAEAALSWGKLYFAVYHTNLLANPYLLPPLRRAQAGAAPGAWVVTAEGGSGWEFELLPNMGEALGEDPSPSALAPSPPASPERHHTLHPPLPCPPYYGSTGQAGAEGGPPRAAVGAGAVASSYRWCELVQEVDLLAELVRRGLSAPAAAAFLDSSPPLSFSVWYAGRADCPSECEARILLAGCSSSQQEQRHHPAAAAGEAEGAAGMPAPELPPHLSSSAGRLWSWTTGTVQPGRGCWHRARCVVAGYPAGVRRAVVMLRGRDLRFWTGHYGAKLAAPSLHFLSPEELDAAEAGLW